MLCAAQTNSPWKLGLGNSSFNIHGSFACSSLTINSGFVTQYPVNGKWLRTWAVKAFRWRECPTPLEHLTREVNTNIFWCTKVTNPHSWVSETEPCRVPYLHNARDKQTLLESWNASPYPRRPGGCSSPASRLCTETSASGLGAATPPGWSLQSHP